MVCTAVLIFSSFPAERMNVIPPTMINIRELMEAIMIPRAITVAMMSRMLPPSRRSRIIEKRRERIRLFWFENFQINTLMHIAANHANECPEGPDRLPPFSNEFSHIPRTHPHRKEHTQVISARLNEENIMILHNRFQHILKERAPWRIDRNRIRDRKSV